MQGSGETVLSGSDAGAPGPAGTMGLRGGRRGRAVVAGLFCAWAVSFVWQTLFFQEGSVYFLLHDDAMILMRYAANLVGGHGPVWNPGERVEGYTSSLMVLVMAGGIGVFGKHGGVLFVHLLGLACLLGTAALGVRLYGRVCPPPDELSERGRATLSVFVFLVGLAYLPLAYWALLGMETGLLALLITGATYVVVRAGEEPRVAPLFPVLCGLAFWTRPDAAIAAALLFAYRLWRLRGQPRGLLTWSAEALIAGAFVAALTGFRLAYFGQWVPNTYFLKVDGIPLETRLLNGWLLLKPYLPGVTIPVLAAAAWVWWSFTAERLLLLGLYLSSVVYWVWAGGDAWPVWRLMAPYTLPLMLLVLELLYRIVWVVAASPNAPRLHWYALGMAVALLLVSMNRSSAGPVLRLDVEFSHEVLRMALALDEVTTPDATLAVTWAGTIPYYTERPAIDMLGKSDAVIARLPPRFVDWRSAGALYTPGHNKFDLHYSIVEKAPSFVQTFTWGADSLEVYGREYYEHVVYKGVLLRLRRYDPNVLWEHIRAEMRAWSSRGDS